jgi:hypothetical protein
MVAKRKKEKKKKRKTPSVGPVSLRQRGRLCKYKEKN